MAGLAAHRLKHLDGYNPAFIGNLLVIRKKRGKEGRYFVKTTLADVVYARLLL